ncbi:hypothetical protein [Bailinhaonella thermotolerans]|uniref:Uncharacterized protein n=1 Tax=Bailinhaonella thermotolerans TaxID=1070861 RepID=A0A3A4AYM7_9ACTN|nr:hypothetical protein [Bailinhaonella thermotolerans]RJL34223.1 hypothetical protein D5H75_07075 [Bailinhaonella thermotolerans]
MGLTRDGVPACGTLPKAPRVVTYDQGTGRAVRDVRPRLPRGFRLSGDEWLGGGRLLVVGEVGGTARAFAVDARSGAARPVPPTRREPQGPPEPAGLLGEMIPPGEPPGDFPGVTASGCLRPHPG